MTKLKGILLTEGMHGMISQVEGLAKALDLNYSHHTVETKVSGKLYHQNSLQYPTQFLKKLNAKILI